MNDKGGADDDDDEISREGSSDTVHVHLDLLPFPHAKSLSQNPFQWLHANANLISTQPGKEVGANRQLLADEEGEEAVTVSSPNSAVSSFQMEFGSYRTGRGGDNKRDFEALYNHGEATDTVDGTNSDEEDLNGMLARKKLRLTKDQSAFLEDSFKKHSTLNPTEVDCEFLKRCCKTVTEEHMRLQKELQELRALKSSKPFYMQLPATTLTMCPSCERIAATTTAATSVPAATSTMKPRLHPFLKDQVHELQASS